MSDLPEQASAVESRWVSQPFRPRARVLQLLGDELIGRARLAVFELVMNAYDADANEVVVRLDLASAQEPTITVTDDGEGMTLDVLQSVWLVPGDDHRQKQRLADQRTVRHRRLPLGEKGLGRFAVHKLGNRIIESWIDDLPDVSEILHGGIGRHGAGRPNGCCIARPSVERRVVKRFGEPATKAGVRRLSLLATSLTERST